MVWSAPQLSVEQVSPNTASKSQLTAGAKFKMVGSGFDPAELTVIALLKHGTVVSAAALGSALLARDVDVSTENDCEFELESDRAEAGQYDLLLLQATDGGEVEIAVKENVLRIS